MQIMKMTDLAKQQNFYQALCQQVQRRPQALALAFADRHISYQQFYQRVQQTMLQLSQHWQLHKGDRLLLALGNHPAFCELFFAALGLGIEVIPFSTKLKQAEAEALVRHIAPQMVFYDSNNQDWLADTQCRCVSLEAWNHLSLPDGECPQAAITADDVAVMMFTSGTTGEPKGAMITHANLYAAVTAYAQCFSLSDQDSTLLAVPVCHITGLVALLALFIYLGASIWLQQRFQPAQVINTLVKERISFLHGSPTVFMLLCQHIRNQQTLPDNNHPASFPYLRTIACGAGYLNAGLIKELKERFPRTAIRPVYGLTETTSPATIFPTDIWQADKQGSAGLPITGLTVMIRDDQNKSLAAGQTGHIWLKGNVVIDYYWQYDGKHTARDNQGWFYTGDLGYLDKDGYLFIQDRSKDMINRGGEKIYSIELENIISLYPGVREVAVVSAASQIYGEEPVAFIVPEHHHYLTSNELLQWLKTKISRFKLPVKIIFSENLPRTHNGKINKRLLKIKLAESAVYFSQED